MPRRTPSTPADEQVHSITSVSGRHSEDVDARMKRYALQMGLRMICLILAVMVEGWLRWVFMVGVIVLPWLAVVWANGVHRADAGPGSYATPVQAPALSTAPEETSSERSRADRAADEVFEGQVIEDPPSASPPGPPPSERSSGDSP